MVAHQKRVHSLQNKKRAGKHHNHSRHYLKVYLPYMPLTVIVALSVLFGSWQPIVAHKGTLAYATDVSISGLLSSTNTQRNANGAGSLSINSQLDAAAQAKANDMVTRNYWSHNTPDGKEPWVFIDQAGYVYTKAGENLAYGFSTSGDTVVGWMNSPTHRANLLDTSFTDVGFGFANSNNFNSTGPETIVVAMYGKPQTLGAVTQAQPTASTPAAKPAAAPTAKATPAPTTAPTPAPTPVQATPKPTAPVTKPVTTSLPVVAAQPTSRQVSRIAALTQGKAPWALFAVGLITGLAMMTLLVRHSLAFRHLLRDSERLVLHHPLLDITLVSLVLLGLSMASGVGVIL